MPPFQVPQLVAKQSDLLGLGLSIVDRLPFVCMRLDVSHPGIVSVVDRRTVEPWVIILRSNKINPTWCALGESHGHESGAHKLFMRYTGKKPCDGTRSSGIRLVVLVFVADLLIYYPAVLYTYRHDQLNKNVETKKVGHGAR